MQALPAPDATTVKGSVQHQFGAVADRYARSTTHASGADLDALVAASALNGSERVLDLGCGAGYSSLALAHGAREVHALDLTQAMLDQAEIKAREHGVENIRFRRGDAEDLPYPDRSFDVVASRVSAHHYAHVEAAVREAARVLKPGGRFVVSDTMSPESGAEDTFLNCIELLRDASHVRNHRVSEWLRMMREAGFEAELVGRFNMLLDFESWFERMQTPAAAAQQVRRLFTNTAMETKQEYAYDPSNGGSWRIPVCVVAGRRESLTPIARPSIDT